MTTEEKIKKLDELISISEEALATRQEEIKSLDIEEMMNIDIEAYKSLKLKLEFEKSFMDQAMNSARYRILKRDFDVMKGKALDISLDLLDDLIFPSQSFEDAAKDMIIDFVSELFDELQREEWEEL